MINGKSKLVNGGTQTSALDSSWRDLGFTTPLSSLEVQGDTGANTVHVLLQLGSMALLLQTLV